MNFFLNSLRSRWASSTSRSMELLKALAFYWIRGKYFLVWYLARQLLVFPLDFFELLLEVVDDEIALLFELCELLWELFELAALRLQLFSQVTHWL